MLVHGQVVPSRATKPSLKAMRVTTGTDDATHTSKLPLLTLIGSSALLVPIGTDQGITHNARGMWCPMCGQKLSLVPPKSTSLH